MGLSEEDQKRFQESRLQLNGGSDVVRRTNEPTQKNEISSAVCGCQVDVVGYCRANGSSPCCQTPSVPEKMDNPDLNEKGTKLRAEKKSSKIQISQNNSGKGTCTRRVCTMPMWFESWEREDTYAALAVIGVALSVAFAYNCYKQLSRLRQFACQAVHNALTIVSRLSTSDYMVDGFFVIGICKMEYSLYRIQLCTPPTSTSVQYDCMSCYREGFIIAVS